MIRDEIKKAIGLPDVAIERPENKNFGDYSTNAALKLAKKEGKNPLELARAMVEKIKALPDNIFAKIEVAPPGFINFTLSENYLQKQVNDILEAKDAYGKLEIGRGQKIQVEFISANPTGPLTLGNGRGGFFGDVLAKVLVKAGFNVEREYYINDAGYQIEVLMRSVKEGKGDYLKMLRKKFKDNLEYTDKLIVWGQQGSKKAMADIREEIEKTVVRMGIKFDVWFSERDQLRESGKVDEMLKSLKDKKLTYEKDRALWFKSSDFGDDKDRVLITSDENKREEGITYFLSDIAYHYDKFVNRKFDKVIDIWGADHHGYVARLQATGKALGAWDESKLKIIIMQLVRLFEGGKEVKMSKRTGTAITLDDLLDEISLDVARFFFLMRSPDTHMDFDLDLAKEQSQKNPVYYIQYAHARICAILRKSGKSQSTNYKSQTKFELLDHPAELNLIKQLIRLPEIIEDTAGDYQVHRLPQYALDLVRQFHRFYEECRVLAPSGLSRAESREVEGIDEANKARTQARLALCEATKIVLANTLGLMGINAPEKM